MTLPAHSRPSRLPTVLVCSCTLQSCQPHLEIQRRAGWSVAKLSFSLQGTHCTCSAPSPSFGEVLSNRRYCCVHLSFLPWDYLVEHEILRIQVGEAYSDRTTELFLSLGCPFQLAEVRAETRCTDLIQQWSLSSAVIRRTPQLQAM